MKEEPKITKLKPKGLELRIALLRGYKYGSNHLPLSVLLPPATDHGFWNISDTRPEGKEFDLHSIPRYTSDISLAWPLWVEMQSDPQKARYALLRAFRVTDCDWNTLYTMGLFLELLTLPRIALAWYIWKSGDTNTELE